MKKLILLFTFLFLTFSCSENENECLNEKLEIIERFNKLIELAENDGAEKASLIKQRGDKIKLLGC